MGSKNGNAKVGAVMVVGAGIAGIQASLDLAEAGFYVHLVDHSPTIGGLMPQLDKTFPTNDCSYVYCVSKAGRLRPAPQHRQNH